jgi:endonuclease YncB( thermonuclease family)
MNFLPGRDRSRSPVQLALLFGLALLGLGATTASAGAVHTLAQGGPALERVEAPQELFEVVKIIDGDTLHITRAGKLEKLRLLSVDTEEKLTPGMQDSPSKPQTVFGEETRLWTAAFLEQFRAEDGKLRVGLAFPEGREARDVYGRLLCHVLLPDGSDFNLLLVELGKSPYFNKYGNSQLCHEAFVAAQRRARRNLLGIWNPSTNRAADGETPSVLRPYERLLPWWQARADAIEEYRRASRRSPQSVLSAEDPAALAGAEERGTEVEVFGTPERFFEEEDGSLTVLLRSSDRAGALRISIPAAARPAFEALDLPGLLEDYRQNFVFVRGVVTRGARSFLLISSRPAAWRRAGPELR